MNKHQVTMPDGKIAKRNSENRRYTHAIICVVTEARKAAAVARLEGLVRPDNEWSKIVLENMRASRVGKCRVYGWAGSLRLAQAAGSQAARNVPGCEVVIKEAELVGAPARADGK